MATKPTTAYQPRWTSPGSIALKHGPAPKKIYYYQFGSGDIGTFTLQQPAPTPLADATAAKVNHAAVGAISPDRRIAAEAILGLKEKEISTSTVITKAIRAAKRGHPEITPAKEIKIFNELLTRAANPEDQVHSVVAAVQKNKSKLQLLVQLIRTLNQ